MRQRFANFMLGRNGNDAFNRFLLIVGAVLLLLGSILNRTVPGRILYLLALAVLVYTYFRMFSRDLYRRRSENERFLREKEKLAARCRVLVERWRQRKDYKFFTCPSCKAVMRVPRHRGKIRIVCHKCGTTFMGKS